MGLSRNMFSDRMKKSKDFSQTHEWRTRDVSRWGVLEAFASPPFCRLLVRGMLFLAFMEPRPEHIPNLSGGEH